MDAEYTIRCSIADEALKEQNKEDFLTEMSDLLLQLRSTSVKVVQTIAQWRSYIFLIS